MSFFKKLNENNLLEAPNFVYHKDFTLKKEDANLHSMTEQDGWKWFDTQAEAVVYFSITELAWTPDRLKEFLEIPDNKKVDLLNKNLSSLTIDNELKNV